MPDTWEHTLSFLEWTEYDLTWPEIRRNASDYSFVWAAVYPRLFRIANPEINVGWYQPAFLDRSNARPEAIWPSDDTPETRGRTLLWWTTEADGVGHPDWVLYKCDGATPAYQMADLDESAPNMPLDFTNPEVIDWQLRESLMGDEESGYTALSADLFMLNNTGAACGVYRDGEWLQLFSGELEDPAFAAAAVEWAQQMRVRLYQLTPPAGLIVNFPTIAYSDEQIATVAANVDGILDEGGFMGFSDDGPIEGVWLAEIRNMIAAQDRGDAFYSINYVDDWPPAEWETNWILSSFLMGREHSAYLIITTHDGPRWPFLDIYDDDIGHPCGPMRMTAEQFDDSAYLRDFSRGISIANPDRRAWRVVSLPPNEQFWDLWGNPITENTLELPTQSGKVLLTTHDRCS